MKNNRAAEKEEEEEEIPAAEVREVETPVDGEEEHLRMTPENPPTEASLGSQQEEDADPVAGKEDIDVSVPNEEIDATHKAVGEESESVGNALYNPEDIENSET